MICTEALWIIPAVAKIPPPLIPLFSPLNSRNHKYSVSVSVFQWLNYFRACWTNMDVLCICFICLNLIVSSVMGLWWWVFLMFVKRDQLHNSNHYFRWCVWDIMVWQLHTSLIWSFAISRPAWANSFDGMSGFDPVNQCGGYSDVFTFISFYLFFLEPLSIGAKIDEYTLGSLDRFFFSNWINLPVGYDQSPTIGKIHLFLSSGDVFCSN